MRLTFSRSVAIIALGFSAMTFTLPTASAQGVELNIGRDGPSLRLQDDNCNPRREDCSRDRRSDRRADRGCTQDRALDKAERMGVRRASIVSMGRRTIEVRGRDRRGDRVRLTFGRVGNCPVL